MGLLVGTSGWQYRDWKGAFYPRELAQKAWLEHYAERFAVVEVNNTFYRLPERKTFEDWAARTPDDFRFVIKASRYLTHVRRLQEPRRAGRAPAWARPGAWVRSSVPSSCSSPRTSGSSSTAWRRRSRSSPATRCASPSKCGTRTWLVDEVFALLARHDVALVLADRAGRRDEVRRTASWGYVRLHEGTASPRPCYGDAALRSWADRIADTWAPADDVYVFFNNDPRACAVRNAMRFSELAARTQR